MVDTTFRVLVLSPSYPSLENPYPCAFVHARVREYMAAGVKPTVVIPTMADTETSCSRVYEGVKVHLAGIAWIRKRLAEGPRFDVIVVHFANVPLLNILERESHRIPVVVCVHGGEVLCETYTCGPGRPYFTRERPLQAFAPQWEEQKSMLRRLAGCPRFVWVFVSPFLKETAERFLGVRFLRSEVISNAVDLERFALRPKHAKHRTHIFVCRRFDNEQVYALDTVVLAILALSRRPLFEKLTFHIYGDGSFYETLLAPIKKFPNVHLKRHFIPNKELPQCYAQCGIGLFPSRYDSQPVAIAEAAAAGLVVVGGKLPINEWVFPEKEFGTLVDPDSPEAIATVIERFYEDPEAFRKTSAQMGKYVRTYFSKEATIYREIALLRQLRAEAQNLSANSTKVSHNVPVLSVIVPAYNAKRYLDICLESLLGHHLTDVLEVLVVNDGSTDETGRLAKEYEQRFPGIVRLIDKSNGGHGSCINAALAVARGTYVRIVDSDDWVVSSTFEDYLCRLQNESADCVLTSGCYDYLQTGNLHKIISYDNLPEGHLRHFDDILFEGYGFSGYGPILSSATWKRVCLETANVKIDEGVAYADMEWNVFPLRTAENVVWYDLDIYRYTQGRQGQSISPKIVRKRWKDHDYVFWKVLDFCEHEQTLSDPKRNYIRTHVLAEIACNHVYILFIACGRSAVTDFLRKLSIYPEAYHAALRHIEVQHGTSWEILCRHPFARYSSKRLPFSFPILFWWTKSLLGRLGGKTLISIIKKSLPYGIVTLWQHKIYAQRF